LVFRLRPLLFSCLIALSVWAAPLAAQKPAPPQGGADSIQPGELTEWLSYIASDELQGREIFSEGLGLAAAYLADHLKEWGVQPGGDNGSYFQTVKVLGVRSASKASVTVNVKGQTRTFKDGEGIIFPKNMGARQTIDGDRIQFVGYGLQVPAAGIDDYANVDPKGKIVIYLGQGPKTLPQGSSRLLNARARRAVEKGATAVIGVAGTTYGGRRRTGAAAQGTDFTGKEADDFTTVQRYDLPVAPALTAGDEFFEFLFSGSDFSYADLEAKASRQEPLPVGMLKGVRISITVDADYTVVRTRLTRNVVGIVPGTDRALKDTYVAFGAHYDHIGYAETSGPVARGFGPGSAGGCTGQTRDTPRAGDTINNGADDDGSGTVALMALAKAFALGPRPKRSLLFMWHSGEESGLYGSRYNADFPIVPLDRIAAQLNIDMIGRNRCDEPSEENTVYVVGSDRISTELHNLDEEANASLAVPLKLDYELNDPADPESIYTRSDHYSYASKGIPIIFYTTGLHRDYHYVTDEVSKIDFPKMAHVTQLVYATGMKVGNLDHVPVRDNKGPRKGKGTSGRIETGR
jgi:hypothetical protein